MITSTLGLSSFIAANPGFVAWILGGLITFIAAILSVYHGVLLKRHSDNAEAIKRLAERVTTAEINLRGHTAEVKRARSEFNGLAEILKGHMNREEHEVWDGIRDLGERMARMEGQLENIHQAMPNGDLAEAVKLLRRLVGQRG